MLCLTVLYAAYLVVFVRPYFKVEKIEVHGELRALTKQDIAELSGIKKGDHLLRIPVGQIQRDLVNNPWLKEVAVHRKMPHLVWIYVKEYIPVAIVKTDSYFYVDKFGVSFKAFNKDDDADFPIITGLNVEDENLDKEELRSKIVELLKVLNIYEESFVGEKYGISEIHFSENRGISIITLNDPMELRLGFGSFAEKIDRFESAYSAIKLDGGIISYVDFSSEGKVVVKYGT